MSIRTIDIKKYEQSFNVSLQNKEKYGEVNTDFKLINKILDLIPPHKFKNPNLKWLDPCCGSGYFSMVLYERLFSALKSIFPNQDLRHKHIVSEMMHMVELNEQHIPAIEVLFGENAHIINDSFFNIMGKYDVIYGNPPFNIKGRVKVPTNSRYNKKEDGSSIWQAFITKAVSLLRQGTGYLAFITPSIWMKRDHPMHKFMLQYYIEKLHTMSNTETNRAFHGQAQTPTCYFTMIKTLTNKSVRIYDECAGRYITWKSGDVSISLPLFGASLLQKLRPYVEKYGHLVVKKTCMRPGYKGLSLKETPDEEHIHPNIKTCILDKLQPHLIINFSNKKCAYSGTPKLVLAHKMYGFPYYDASGTYGISNRDNYVIIDKSYEQCMQLKGFLSTKLALYLFEATRYRMKYLEKYIFEMLPDITSISDFPKSINDESVADYFNLTKKERKAITNKVGKNYKLVFGAEIN